MLRHADGFDHWGTAANAKSFYTAVNMAISNANPRTGTWSALLNHGNNQVFWDTVALGRTVFNQAAFSVATPITARQGFFINGANGYQLCVYLAPGNKIQVVQSSGNVLLAESAVNVWAPGSYVQVAFKLFLGAANGSIEVRLNGSAVPVILATGLALSNTNVNLIGFCGDQALSTFIDVDMYIDDWAYNDETGAFDNDFLGDIRCRTRFATGNGPLQGWTPNSAPAWGEIDNVPPDAAHFLTSGAVNDVSNFTLTQLPTNTAYSAGLVMFSNINKSDAGACQVIPQISSNGVVASGAAISPGTGAAFYKTVFETDPNTGLPFLLPALQLALGQVDRSV